MKLISLHLCRNEGWTIEACLRAALRYCDEAVVLNHASTDDSSNILAALRNEFQDRVHVLVENDPFFMEMTFRHRTLVKARAQGATHCLLVDPDEILCETMVPTIRGQIESLQPGEVLQIPWVTLWRSLDQYRSDDCIWARAMVSMAFCDTPGLHWESREGGYQHHHRHPMGSTHKHVGKLSDGGLLHYQHASWRRLLAKQSLYQMREVLHYPQFTANQIVQRYGPTVDEGGLRRTAVPAEWWGPEKSLIRLDDEPWQEIEVKRLIQEHGRDRFRDINLFGIA